MFLIVVAWGLFLVGGVGVVLGAGNLEGCHWWLLFLGLGFLLCGGVVHLRGSTSHEVDASPLFVMHWCGLLPSILKKAM